MNKNFYIVHQNRLKSRILKKWEKSQLLLLVLAFMAGFCFSWCLAISFFLITSIIGAWFFRKHYLKHKDSVIETVFNLDKELKAKDFFPTAFEAKATSGIIYEQITELTEKYFIQIFATESVCIVHNEIKQFMLKKFIPISTAFMASIILFHGCLHGDRQPENGDRQQENGDGQPENGDRQPENGDRQQENGDGQQESGDRQQENGDRQQENGDRQQENGDGQQENGDGQQENGDGQQENGDGQPENGDRQQENGDWQQENGDGQQENGDRQQEQKKTDEKNNQDNNFDPNTRGDKLHHDSDDDDNDDNETVPFSDHRQLEKGKYIQSQERLEALFANPNLPTAYKTRLKLLFEDAKK